MTLANGVGRYIPDPHLRWFYKFEVFIPPPSNSSYNVRILANHIVHSALPQQVCLLLYGKAHSQGRPTNDKGPTNVCSECVASLDGYHAANMAGPSSDE